MKIQTAHRRADSIMWERVPVCLELISPLHIGFLPNAAGTVIAPTRPYVPGKNLWGAVTASVASRLRHDPTPADFAHLGTDIRENCAFSYCYLSDGQDVFVADSGRCEWGVPINSE